MEYVVILLSILHVGFIFPQNFYFMEKYDCWSVHLNILFHILFLLFPDVLHVICNWPFFHVQTCWFDYAHVFETYRSINLHQTWVIRIAFLWKQNARFLGTGSKQRPSCCNPWAPSLAYCRITLLLIWYELYFTCSYGGHIGLMSGL